MAATHVKKDETEATKGWKLNKEELEVHFVTNQVN